MCQAHRVQSPCLVKLSARQSCLVKLSARQSHVIWYPFNAQVKESAAKKGTLYPENSAEVQRVRKIGLKIAEIAAKNKGGGFTGHMEVTCSTLSLGCRHYYDSPADRKRAARQGLCGKLLCCVMAAILAVE